jgi:hypothetical protein
MNERQDYFTGSWDPTAGLPEYYMAVQYAYETEAYDRMMCHLRNERGIAMPYYSWERANCSTNAMVWTLAHREAIRCLGGETRAYRQHGARLTDNQDSLREQLLHLEEQYGDTEWMEIVRICVRNVFREERRKRGMSYV